MKYYLPEKKLTPNIEICQKALCCIEKLKKKWNVKHDLT